LQHAQHPKIGVFLQLRAAAGGGRGHVLGGFTRGRHLEFFFASGWLPQCARCFAARGTGVFFLGSWREVARMTVRKWTILVVVCGFGALRDMFFITCPASDCLCGSPPLRAIVFVNWGHKLGSDPDLTK
jgi:hypothetical protein